MAKENHQFRIDFFSYEIKEIVNKGQQKTLYKINDELIFLLFF